MQTAHEILMEERAARMQREAIEKKWAALVGRASRRPPPVWVQVAMALVFLGYFQFVIHPATERGIAVFAVVPLLFGAICYVVNQRRRENALLAIVEQEAPELYRKLQHEGVA